VNKLNTAIAFTLTILLGCSESEPATDAAQAAEQAIERAQAKFDQSRAVGHAWLPTKQSLAAAKQAFGDADYTSAITQAGRAEALAEASLAQAESEQNAWHERFPTMI
jgi:hypothetical protein